MSRMLVVKEIPEDGGKVAERFFKFPLDAKGEFDYRSRMTINAFFYSARQRNYKPSYSKWKFLYYASHLDAFESERALFAKQLGRDIYADVPMVELTSVWEFYKLIGWEHKTKTWRIGS